MYALFKDVLTWDDADQIYDSFKTIDGRYDADSLIMRIEKKNFHLKPDWHLTSIFSYWDILI